MFLVVSVVVAILGREPGFEEIKKRPATIDGALYISPLVMLEVSVALARLSPVPSGRLPICFGRPRGC